VAGEIAYVWGKLTGTAHCALCDVTHGLRMKAEWKALVASLDIPFRLVHLNERPDPLVALTDGKTPCVVAQSRDGFRIVVGREELEGARGSVKRFTALLRLALESRDHGESGPGWPHQAGSS
jgi:hypothetical protein